MVKINIINSPKHRTLLALKQKVTWHNKKLIQLWSPNLEKIHKINSDIIHAFSSLKIS